MIFKDYAQNALNRAAGHEGLGKRKELPRHVCSTTRQTFTPASEAGRIATVVIREVCPFHADDDVVGIPSGNDDASLIFTCMRKGHPGGGDHSWLRVPAPPDVPGVDGLAAGLGLAIDLPAALKQYAGTWVEYGIVERAYALANPAGFARIVAEFGHRAIKPQKYTASAFLARTLGALGRQGTVAFHLGPATGYWAYNETISWWAVPPAPEWGTDHLSWAEASLEIDYLP